MGHETQYLRPISVALAVRDVLEASSKSCRVLFTNEPIISENNLISCYGETSLAEGVIELLKDGPEAIFILTDGYENTTSGRLNETLRLIRKVGIEIPVFQISPVMASEAFGIRRLSSHAVILPVNDPKALPVSMIRGLFELDLGKAIQVLFENTYPLLKS